MKNRITVFAAAGMVFALVSCSSAPKVDYEALVVERFGECLAALNVPLDGLDSVVTGSGDTVDGSVFVPLRPGVMLEWIVKPNQEGGVLTVPDAVSTEELAKVGC